jgi:crossover junction endodeoxyribonuclease RuvC
MKKIKAWIGIDPGKTGSAVLITNGKKYEYYDYEDDFTAAAWMRDMHDKYSIERVFIEHLTPQPKWPAKTNFVLGGSYHGWKHAWAVLNIPVTTVRPLKWQQGLFSKEDKTQGKSEKHKSVFYVRREHPDMIELCKFLKHHGRCDAFLIAKWGKSQEK